MQKLFENYDPGRFFCELFGPPRSNRRPVSAQVARIVRRLNGFNLGALRRRSREADQELYNLGITFTVYTEQTSVDRILPFDVLPRVLSAQDWAVIERGVRQRIEAINLFLHDVYHDRKVLKDGVVPEDLVLGNPHYCPQMAGVKVPGGVYVHVCGIDVVRDRDGSFKVLEDNARIPSGVSYVIENRHLMLRTFPDFVANVGIRSVSDYGPRLHQALAQVAPGGKRDADVSVALLSPGIYNSAYFEHVFLAREMGVPLVEGRDLTIEKDRVYMKTAAGLEPVDVIYRRVDDAFLDPQAFNPNSVLGVPGLFAAYKKGGVTLANAVGTGVADDKAVYAYMPRIIRYYLDQDPILENVETYICREAEGLAHALAHLPELVVKPVGESGGYGVLIGPQASAAAIARRREELRQNPANYIAQPVVDLSVCPTLTPGGVEPRHVDLRPFAVTGNGTWVLPGGLTRVALTKGSLVVNSSQGGGSKDTWVLED